MGSLDIEASLPTCLRHHALLPQLAVGDNRGMVRVWDWKKHAVTNCFAATGGPREASGTPTLHAPVTELAFINLCESNLLLVGGADGCVRIWHNYAQRTSRRLASSWCALPRQRSMLAAQAGPNMLLPCAAVYEWKQECGYLYAAGDELPVPLVHVWDAGREQCVGEISTQSSAAVTCLSCAPGETGTLVGGTANGGVFTFDVRTPTGLLSSSQCHSQGVVNAFSSEHNPHTIISGSGGGELKWWDIRGGISTPYRTVRTAKAGISAIAPHPHLPLLACGSTDQAVEIFNTKEGEQLNILKHQNSFLGHRIPPVHCLDFHPFAVQLAVGSTDGSVAEYKAPKKEKRPSRSSTS